MGIRGVCRVVRARKIPRKGSVAHAEALLSKLPPEAKQLLDPTHPLMLAIIDARTIPPAQGSIQIPAEPAADGRDLKEMDTRVRARAELVLASLVCGKTHREVAALGIPWPEIAAYLHHYPTFHAVYKRVIAIADDYKRAVRIEEAHIRAVDGWEEPVYFKGKKCGTVRRYSDKMLSLLLAGDDPAKFSPHKQVDVTHTHDTGDRLTALLDQIAARGRFDPLRDLPGNARFIRDGEASAPQSVTNPEPVPKEEAKTRGIGSTPSDVIAVGGEHVDDSDNSGQVQSKIQAPAVAEGDDHFGDA